MLLALVTLVLFVVSIAAGAKPWNFVLLAVWLGGAMGRAKAGEGGELTAFTKEIQWQGKRMLRRNELKAALLIPQRGNRPLVALERHRGSTLRFEVASEEEGRDLMRALGLDPDHKVASFILPTMKLRRRTLAFSLSAALGFGGLFGMVFMGSLLPGAATIAAVSAYALFVWLTRTRVHIGADGISINSLGMSRFIRQNDIEGATASRGVFTGVKLALRSGEVLRLPTTTHPDADQGLAAGIAGRINDGQRSTQKADAPREATMLARGRRTAAAWYQALRSMAAGANINHRTAPVDPARAFCVLEDPAAAASARAGAAVLLGAIADEKDRARLRVTAAAVAAPSVRVVIERAAEGASDEALLEALSAVEEAERAASRKARRRPRVS